MGGGTTPDRKPRDASESSWPRAPLPSPGASPSARLTSPLGSPSARLTSPFASPSSRPASNRSSPSTSTTPRSGGARRTPRKPLRPSHNPAYPLEMDSAVLARREKQLEYGRNTIDYQTYTDSVPRTQRLGYHPRTPIKRRQQSRRRWDNAVRCWRVHLHYWNDPEKLAELRSKGELQGSDAGDEGVEGDGAAEGDGGGDVKEEGDEAMAGEGGGDAGRGEVASGGCAEEEVGVMNWADDVEGLALEME